MEELEVSDSATPRFYNYLLNAGCNMDWLFTGKGSPYADNVGGLILQYWPEDEKIRNFL